MVMRVPAETDNRPTCEFPLPNGNECGGPAVIFDLDEEIYLCEEHKYEEVG